MTGAAQRAELCIDWMGRPFTANARDHWAAKARKVRAWREAGCMAARIAGLTNAAFPRVAVTFQARYKHNKLTDPTNIAPCTKAVLDGLRDAGTIADDTGAYVASERFLPPFHAPSLPDALLVTVERAP